MPSPQQRDRRHRRQRGVALVVVLWGLALVAVAVVAIGLAGRSQTLQARNAVENARARLAAESGVQLGLRRLLAAASQGSGAGGSGGSGAVRGFDGTPDTWKSGDGADVAVAIRDEGGKIDLNEAAPELLAGLAAEAGASPDQAARIACAIVERRGYLPPGCAPSGVSLGLFAALEELRFVPGMTDALYRRMAPAATVHSGAVTIDPRVAGREALLAVPTLTPDIVDSILAGRESRRGSGFGWSSDPLSGGSGSEADELRDRRYFSVSTAQVFAITATARSAGGGRAKAEAVIRLTGDAKRPYLVLAWREPSE